MKTAAEIIIDLIERFDVHDAGSKRAHGNGTLHRAAVHLNAEGKKVFGDVERATVRLSNAATSKKIPEQLVNIKGCSIRFHHPIRAIDIIGVNFPYFPFSTSSEVINLMYNIHLYVERKNVKRFLNIFRAGGLYSRLDSLLAEMPKRTDMGYKYYTTHSYGKDTLKFRMDYDPQSGNIELYSEMDPYITEHCPRRTTHLGNMSIGEEKVQGIKFFDTMNAPFGRAPNGEIPYLRHFLYRRSFFGRLQETEIGIEEYRLLKELWAEEKHYVLLKDPEIFYQIENLFNSSTGITAGDFECLIDQTYERKYTAEKTKNFLENIWPHFAHRADAQEIGTYHRLLDNPEVLEVYDFVSSMSSKYEVAELVDSVVVKLMGRKEYQHMQKGKI
ncbi:catalase family protein [Salinicoccus jeotgali]|uniref:Uncharacterized protein n=1 Tax=Salinicoccus jeotgali TaxID=381634 RepID=A0ABP7F9I3_9STAP